MSETTQDIRMMDRKNGISGLVTAPIGYLVLLFLPVFLEVASKDLNLSEQQVGQLGSADSAGLALATLLCAFVIKRLDFRLTAFVGIAIAVTGNLLSVGVENFDTLRIIRTFAGFGEGLLVAIGISAVGMTSNPGRWFGLYTAAIVLMQAFGLLFVAPVYGQWQLPGVFIMMAILYLVPLTVMHMLPVSSVCTDVEDSHLSNHQRPNSLLLLALAATLFFYICIGGIWAYVSFMGTATGLTLEYVSIALSIAMGAGFLGALFFASISQHAKRHSLLAIATFAMIFFLWRLNHFESGVSYIAILCFYSFFWSIVAARLFAVICDADHSGCYISAAQTVVAAGFALGPYIASLLITDYGYLGVTTMGKIALVLCFAAITPLVLWEQRKARLEARPDV